jgi:AsmA family protein
MDQRAGFGAWGAGAGGGIAMGGVLTGFTLPVRAAALQRFQVIAIVMAAPTRLGARFLHRAPRAATHAMSMLRDYFATHRKTRWAGIVLGVFVLLIVLFLIFFDWNYFKPTLARLIFEKTGRPTVIEGDLKVHVWSWNPSAEVDGLSLKNPSWARHDGMVHADRLIVTVSLGRLLRGQLVLPRVEVFRPTVDLERDAEGRASWEFGDASGKPQMSAKPAKIPTIRRLLIEDGKVRVDDRIRKLLLDGTLNAADESGKESAGFSLKCTGSLNEKPFRAQIHGGPLVNLDPDHPYDLEAHLTASDITLDAHASFPKPFDLAQYAVKFSVSGRDLADIYYLTGLALPNTPPFQLGADVRHIGTVFRLQDLKGKLGSSDIEGELEIQAAGEKPKLIAKLRSHSLNMVDLAPALGHPASSPASSLATKAPASHRSSKAPPPTQTPPASDRLFPDADLQVNRVRGMDADVTYQADSVVAPKLPMKQVNFHLQLHDGLLRMDPLAFVLDAGRFSGRVAIDARKDVPETTIDMAIDQVDLAQFKSASAKQPPLEGSLDGRLDIHGFGTSVHKLASTADGSLSVAIPEGQMNDALAELTGINVVRGLGLLLSQKENDTQIRCGIVDFQAQKGMLESKSVFIDTTNVLITGRGNINLGDERLDLTLQGDPKKVRLLRLRSPITLHGTLLRPAVGVKTDKLLAQAGAAIALGTLLTPAAAALALIDPGLAKNKDCSAVMTEMHQDAADQAPPSDNAPANAPTSTPPPATPTNER